jgi:photosystem II stability/assembly factor-like uncharacterized protein
MDLIDQLYYSRTARLPSLCGLSLFFLLFVICIPLNGQTLRPAYDRGDDIEFPISTHQVEDLFFLDMKNGWVVVVDHILNQDRLFRTSDGGASWKESAIPHGIKKLFFLNATNGWALQLSPSSAVSGTITYHLLKTQDGGKHWKQISSHPVVSGSSDTTPVLVDVAFSDSKHGWVVGGAPHNVGWVLQTSTGGKGFHKVDQPSAFFEGCFGVIARGQEVWIYGAGGFLRSPDSGTNWSPISLEYFAASKSLVTLSSGLLAREGYGWLVGISSQAVVLGTKDFGQKWQVQLRKEDPRRFDLISSWDEKHACAAAAPNELFCTADGGETWSALETWPKAGSERANFFERLVILASGAGWTVRGGGYLYQTSDGGRSWGEIDPMKMFAREAVPTPVAHP